MIKVLLYKKEGCHLCDDAEDILARLRKDKNLILERIMLEENTDMFDRYGNKVPIVFINDKMAFEYKLDEQAFVKKLAEFE